MRQRMVGLLGRELDDDECLLLERAPQVHTLGMRYTIDVIFCDRALEVLHVSRALKPFRLSKWVRGARYAIELRAGGASRIDVGDRLEVSSD